METAAGNYTNLGEPSILQFTPYWVISYFTKMQYHLKLLIVKV